ncbi:MAG: trehalose-6-phosphate synthase [bacterium]
MRLIVAANRAPYIIKKNKNFTRVEKSPGGLVAALDVVMKKTKGVWVCSSKENDFYNLKLPYEIRPIALTDLENYHYYEGFGNRQIWPLFHYFPTRYKLHEEDWKFYVKVNQKFANQIFSFVKPDDIIWLHDYHLMLVPGMLRKAGVTNKIGFFLHIPFPNHEIFRIIPRSESILKGLLSCDVIGFHTETYQKHFLECVKKQISAVEIDATNNQIFYKNRTTKAVAHPISIDFNLISKLAKNKCVQNKAEELRNMLQADIIGLGVDRLDYTKGLFEKLNGIESFLDSYPEFHKKFIFIQIAVPSRVEVPEYQKLKKEIDETVGRINGKFSVDGWSPISYIYNSLNIKDLISYYSCADFALVTALRDGLNLVAKEYIASKVNNDGMLILSEFTGAAEELNTGNHINPYDGKSIAAGILRSITTSRKEKEKIMTNLRQHIKTNDIYKWVDKFLCQL